MSERPAIRLRGVGKLYKLFAKRRDYVLDAAGLGALLRRYGVRPRMFWALRDVDLEVPHGRRLGVVGRNGAGKSTLLKIITGALSPTEGTVDVDGAVQALFEAGSGFHPEFTGYENIHAALTYQNLDEAAIRAATEDIARFTELGEFLGQPLKAYSLGMHARLAFAVATATRPKILIVDEVLGAGDAYFASKSSERMRTLVEESGATILLASHDSAAILRYCEECIWIERGRIVKRGRAMDVINSYEGYIHELEDRRLRATNRHRAVGAHAAQDGVGSRQLAVAFRVDGPPGSGCDVTTVSLLKDGVVHETLDVGGAQDSVAEHACVVALPGERWSEPRTRAGRRCRTVLVSRMDDHTGHGEVTITYDGPLQARLSIQLTCRTADGARVFVTLLCEKRPLIPATSVAASPEWSDCVLEIPAGSIADAPSPSVDAEQTAVTPGRELVRWPSEGTLTFERAILQDAAGQERAVFQAGMPLCVRVELKAHRNRAFNLILAASVYRLDGIFITNLVGPPTRIELTAGERLEACLAIPRLSIGDARYVISLSAFDGEVAKETRYDLVARGLEFQVTGNTAVTMHAVMQLPAEWHVGAEASSPGGPK